MCLGIPGQVVTISAQQIGLADVEVAGMTRPINIAMLDAESLHPGDWVLIHAGVAMEKIDEEKARSALAFLEDYTSDPPEPDDAFFEPFFD